MSRKGSTPGGVVLIREFTVPPPLKLKTTPPETLVGDYPRKFLGPKKETVLKGWS